MPKFLTRSTSTGNLKEVSTIAASAGVGSAGATPELDSNGKLDASFMPSGIGADTFVVQASEALTAGAYVDIWDNAGALRVRNADATSTPKPADGFVLSAVASGASATVYFEGQNNARTGLTPGVKYYLSETPGSVTATPVSGAGKIHQYLGMAVSATTIANEIDEPIELA